MVIDGKNPWDGLDASLTLAKERRGHLLELIDSIDGALRPGVAFDDWMRGLFSKKAFSNSDRQLYYTALLTWMRLRGWIQPVLQRSPQRGIAVLCLGLPAGRIRDAFAADLNLPHDIPGRLLPAPDTLRLVAGNQDPFYLSQLLPPWLADQAPWAFSDDAIERWFTPTPMWMRCLPGHREEVRLLLARQHIVARPHPIISDALALPPDTLVTGLDAYTAGFCEVQDIGAQAIVALADPQPGEVWLNTYAGLGRHARAIADLVGETGRVDASDYRQNELRSLLPAAAHARRNIHIVDANSKAGSYDGVFAFALSTCSGLLRHRPWLFHQIDAGHFNAFVEKQDALLAESAPKVRVGGRLVYAVTSVCVAETQKVAARFLENHPDFEIVTPTLASDVARAAGLGWRIHPADLDGDARYVAIFRRVKALEKRKRAAVA